jgi:hypothetical protein
LGAKQYDTPSDLYQPPQNTAYDIAPPKVGVLGAFFKGLPNSRDSGYQYDPNYQPTIPETLASTVTQFARSGAAVLSEWTPEYQAARASLNELRKTDPNLADQIETSSIGQKLSNTKLAIKGAAAVGEAALTFAPWFKFGRAGLAAAETGLLSKIGVVGEKILASPTLEKLYSGGLNGFLYGGLYGLHANDADWEAAAKNAVMGGVFGTALMGTASSLAFLGKYGGNKALQGFDFLRDTAKNLGVPSLAEILPEKWYANIFGVGSAMKKYYGDIGANFLDMYSRASKLATTDLGKIQLGFIDNGLMKAPFGLKWLAFRNIEYVGNDAERMLHYNQVLRGMGAYADSTARNAAIAADPKLQFLDGIRTYYGSAAKDVGVTNELLDVSTYLPKHTPVIELSKSSRSQLANATTYAEKEAIYAANDPMVKEMVDNSVQYEQAFKTPVEAYKTYYDYADIVTGGSHTPMGDNAMLQKMVMDGKAATIEEARGKIISDLKLLKQSLTPDASSLDFKREVNLPWYDPNPSRVMIQYTLDASMRIEMAKMFGVNDEVINTMIGSVKKSLTGEVSADAAARSFEDFVRVVTGQVFRTQKEQRVSAFIRAIQIPKLAFAQIMNLGQSLNTLLASDLGSAMHGLTTAFTTPEIRKSIERGVLMNQFIRQVFDSNGAGGGSRLTDAMLKYNGFTFTEMFNRIVGSSASDVWGEKNLAKLLSDYGIKPGEVGKDGATIKPFTDVLPLTRFDNPKPGYEQYTPDEFIQAGNYKEVVYESSIPTSGGKVHPGLGERPNYFSHVRQSDLYETNGQTRRLLEIQSDLQQRGRLASELPDTVEKVKVGNREFEVIRNRFGTDEKIIKEFSDFQMNDLKSKNDMVSGNGVGVTALDGKTLTRDEAMSAVQEAQKVLESRRTEIAPLEKYNKDFKAHLRTFREFVKDAKRDGKTTLQFPTGETAMKIEGLGETSRWVSASTRNDLSAEGLKVGDEVTRVPIIRGDVVRGGAVFNEDKWIITEVLGDGKFKAVPKSIVDGAMDTLRAKKTAKGLGFNEKAHLDFVLSEPMINRMSEAFDISGKVDKTQFVYRLNETRLPKEAEKMGLKVEKIQTPEGEFWQTKLPSVAQTLQKTFDLTLAEGGATFTLNGELLKERYVYSPSKVTELAIPKEKFTLQHLLDYADKNFDELVREDRAIGNWEYKGDIYMDVVKGSNDLPGSLQEASGAEQIGIYDQVVKKTLIVKDELQKYDTNTIIQTTQGRNKGAVPSANKGNLPGGSRPTPELRAILEEIRADQPREYWALKELGVNPDEIIARGFMTPEEKAVAAQTFVERTQFLAHPSDLPYFASSPAGKTLFQFRTFSYQQARFVTDEIKNAFARKDYARVFRNLLILSTVFPMTGEVLGDVKSLITQEKRPTKAFDRYISDVFSAGTYGLFYDFATSAEQGKTANFFLGAAPSDAIKYLEILAAAPAQIAGGHGNTALRNFSKQLLRQTGIGRVIVNSAYPSTQPGKSTLQSLMSWSGD